jgi:hypothetical protein
MLSDGEAMPPIVIVEPTDEQRALCERLQIEPAPPAADTVVGIGPMESRPMHGLRHPPVGAASGWYLWTGGEIDQTHDHFFQPVHVAHLDRLHPDVVRYLALPAGWRFQVAPQHEDVWFDASLLDVEELRPADG